MGRGSLMTLSLSLTVLVAFQTFMILCPKFSRAAVPKLCSAEPQGSTKASQGFREKSQKSDFKIKPHEANYSIVSCRPSSKQGNASRHLVPRTQCDGRGSTRQQKSFYHSPASQTRATSPGKSHGSSEKIPRAHARALLAFLTTSRFFVL